MDHLAVANAIAEEYGLHAEYLSHDPWLKTVGVQGDKRTYERPIMLTGPWPGHEALAECSRRISAEMPANKVVYEVARRHI